MQVCLVLSQFGKNATYTHLQIHLALHNTSTVRSLDVRFLVAVASYQAMFGASAKRAVPELVLVRILITHTMCIQRRRHKNRI